MDKSGVSHQYSTVVEDITHIAETYPGLPNPLVERDFLIESIQDQLRKIDIVFLNWDQGHGKTTILSQFVQKNAQRTICVFVGSSWSYQPDAVRRDICNQISWIIEGKEIESEIITSDKYDLVSIQNRFFRKLNKHGRHGEPYYVVIDGIEDIPDRDRHVQNEIIQSLPLDAAGIKFVFSGTKEILPEDLQSKVKTESRPYLRFADRDAEEYFGDLVEDVSQIKELSATCQGVPARLAAVRRILEKGNTAESILQLNVSEVESLFEVEWSSVQTDNDRHILALIAFAAFEPDLQEVSQILDLPIDEVRKSLNRFSFVVSGNDEGRLKYVSNSFEMYVGQKLSGLEPNIRDLVIDYLIDDIESDRSVRQLPSLLSESGRHEKLLQIMSPAHFLRIINRGQSLGFINQVSDLVFKAADEKKDLGALARFSLHMSAVTELWGTHAKRSEVKALMALENAEGAMALVDTAVSSVERLHLLAIIARMHAEQGQRVDDELIERIRKLSEEVEPFDLEHRLEEIATDLIKIDPELALRIVERGGEAGSGEHSLDVAYMNLSFSNAIQSQNRNESSISSPGALNDIQSRIQDPGIREISSKMGLLLGDYSASKVIEEAESFDKTGDQLFFLRLWTRSHRRKDDASVVIEYALKQMTKNVKYAHNARLLRELAEPLPFVTSDDKRRKLIRAFDRQKQESILREELVRLEILLARAEVQHDTEAAIDRLDTLYIALLDVEDLATQTEGWARLMSILPLVDPPTPNEEYLLNTTVKDLEYATKDLLERSADHIDATRHVIHGLASNDPKKALELANKLNTEPRRDQATVEFVKAYLDNSLTEVDAGTLFRALNQVQLVSSHQSIVSLIFDRLSAETEYIQIAADLAQRFRGKVASIIDAELRCRAAVQGYYITSKAQEQSVDVSQDETANAFLSEAKSSFDVVDDRTQKIEMAFRIVAQLATVDRKAALHFKEKGEILRSKIKLESSGSQSAFLAGLSLTIRSFRGLLPQKVDDEDDIRRILDLTDKLTSRGDKIKLLADLAFSLYRHERVASGRDIVRSRIRPLFNQISEEDQYLRFRLWAYAAPALYKEAPTQTLNELTNDIPAPFRDRALWNIAESILDKVMPTEPIDINPNRNSKVRAEEMYQLCNILRNIQSDHIAYHLLEQIVESILEDTNSRTYDRSLRREIVDELNNISELSFPNPDYIEHEGYLILSKIDLIRIKNTYSSATINDWLELVNNARLINNRSDRVFVLSKLIEKCPFSKDSIRRRQIKVLEEAEEVIKELPSILDRIDLLESLASAAKKVDINRVRGYYKKAIRLLYERSDAVGREKVSKIQRRIVSSAYRIDPEFASSLSTLADNDPAHQQELRRNIKRLKRRESISMISDEHTEKPDIDYPRICWDGLGSLNAGRITGGVRKDRAMDMLNKARHYPLKHSYPIQSFLVEGLVRAYEKTDEASTVIRPIFEANLQNTHLIERLAVRSASKMDTVKDYATEKSKGRGTYEIKRGERTKALRLIRDWIEENVNDRLFIIDQFFGPREIEALSLVQAIVPDCKIEVLTSEKHHRQEGVDSINKAYTKAWRERYDQKLPRVRIVAAGMKDYGLKSPIHDRWWLTDVNGLRIGTSFNGLGRNQTSEISVLDKSECSEKLEEATPHLECRAPDSLRMTYRVDDLDL